MEEQMPRVPPPIELIASASIFAVFSVLLWLTIRFVLPPLRDTFGVVPMVGT